MRKASRRRTEPTAGSLRELPPIDFSKYRATRNTYAARVAREGIEILHDGPTRESLAEIPETDFSAVRVRRNPYASRAEEAIAKMQIGKGRPRRGQELGATPARSIRLPEAVWNALEGEAKASGTTVHALLRRAVTAYLLGDRGGRGS